MCRSVRRRCWSKSQKEKKEKKELRRVRSSEELENLFLPLHLQTPLRVCVGFKGSTGNMGTHPFRALTRLKINF